MHKQIFYYIIACIFMLFTFANKMQAQLIPTISHDPPSLKIADRAFEIITSLKSTRYKGFPYTIDATKGIYETDCAGFVTHLLKQKAPKHLAFIPFEEGRIYHTVADYYNYFDPAKDGNSRIDTAFWKIISRLDDSKRGDILIWVDDEIDPNISLSHIFVLADTPKSVGDNIYETVVYDACERPYNKDIRTINGIGYGMIRLKTDTSGFPSEYELKIGENFLKSHIVIARAM